jgi:hypothetical protein
MLNLLNQRLKNVLSEVSGPEKKPYNNHHLPLWISALVSVILVLIAVTVIILKKRQVPYVFSVAKFYC